MWILRTVPYVDWPYHVASRHITLCCDVIVLTHAARHCVLLSGAVVHTVRRVLLHTVHTASFTTKMFPTKNLQGLSFSGEAII